MHSTKLAMRKDDGCSDIVAKDHGLYETYLSKEDINELRALKSAF
jgi:hypothetical protein